MKVYAEIKEFIEGFKKKNDEEVVETVEYQTYDLMDAEIQSILEEISSEKPYTERYAAAVNGLETLTKALANVSKAQSEANRVDTDKKIDWYSVGPKIAGVLVYGAVTMMFVAIEKEHPPAMRLVQAANQLLAPRV